MLAGIRNSIRSLLPKIFVTLSAVVVAGLPPKHDVAIEMLTAEGEIVPDGKPEPTRLVLLDPAAPVSGLVQVFSFTLAAVPAIATGDADKTSIAQQRPRTTVAVPALEVISFFRPTPKYLRRKAIKAASPVPINVSDSGSGVVAVDVFP